MLIFLGHPHLLNEVVEFDMGQCLCKAVGNHLISWNVGQLNSLCSHLIADVVVLNVNLLYPRVENRVVGQYY